MSEIWPYIAGIVPTIVVATMFYFLIRSMLEGDRRERLAQSRFEAEQDRNHRDGAASPSDSAVPQRPSGAESAEGPSAPENHSPHS